MGMIFGYLKPKHLLFSAALLSASYLNAANDKTTVEQVTSSVTVSTETDYHITNASQPFGMAGSIDITNENAVVVFDNIKPSKVISTYLANIYVNGQPAVNDENVRVCIYTNGACVYPHKGTGYTPLTVYTEKDYAGESKGDFTPNTYYKSLGAFDNAIKSFKLKRGYMVTFATSSDGTGYSRCFIAQDEDLEVSELPNLLKNKVSFIRVLPWQNISKKGNAGSDFTQIGNLNCTWFYGWDAGNNSQTDFEYVPHRHHIGWPSFSQINERVNVTHVLGHNEPDNGVGGEQPNTPEEVCNEWSNMMQSGLRIGSPAVASNITGWLQPFMELCDENNLRVDFVAAHCYWYNSGSGYNSNVNWYYSLFKRPIWITEFNYGANWTNETWPDADRSGTAKNYEHQKAGLSSIVNALEANSHLERYAIYNWVQDCRMVYNTNDASLASKGYLTPAGEWYADLKSNVAYTGGDGYVPVWNYKSPADLELDYSRVSKRASFTWTTKNGEQTDSMWLERKTSSDSDYLPIAKFGSGEKGSFSYQYDDLDGVSGIVKYRVHSFDSDGRDRYSGEVSLSIGAAEGDKTMQYGELNVSNTDEISTDFVETFDETPAVFMGICTYKNSQVGVANLLTSITTSRFNYNVLPWEYASSQTIANAETIPFMAMPLGNTAYGDMDVEVGTFKANGDTVQVTFTEAFPEGVTPVIISDLRNPVLKTNAISIKTFDVTNKGFKCKLMYEYGVNKNIAVNLNVVYMAVTPGTHNLGNGKILSAGFGNNDLYSTIFKSETFTVNTPDGEQQLKLYNPLIFGALQTCNIDAATIVRQHSVVTEEDEEGNEYVTSARIVRQVDKSNTTVTNNSASADKFGWITLSDDPDYDPSTGIGDVVTVVSDENPLEVSVVNRIIYVENAENYEVYTVNGMKVAANASQEPGIYVVRSGNRSAKVMVK